MTDWNNTLQWFNANAAGIQCIATVLLMLVTAIYVLLVWKQVQLIERRDKGRMVQAIQTIITELEIDLQEDPWHYPESPPLLDSAYATNVWAVSLIGMSADTFRALGKAYLNIEKYNLHMGAASESPRHETRRHNSAQTAWGDAQAAIQAALKALKEDPATAPLFAATDKADQGSA